MTLSKDQILEADDLKSVEVDVPEWGGTVRVRTMTGADRNSFEASLITIGPDGSRVANLDNMKAKLVAMTMVDGDGNRLFVAEDVPRLALKSAAALDRIFEAAQNLNGMGVKAEAAAEKNFEPAPSGSSTSD